MKTIRRSTGHQTGCPILIALFAIRVGSADRQTPQPPTSPPSSRAKRRNPTHSHLPLLLNPSSHKTRVPILIALFAIRVGSADRQTPQPPTSPPSSRAKRRNPTHSHSPLLLNPSSHQTGCPILIALCPQSSFSQQIRPPQPPSRPDRLKTPFSSPKRHFRCLFLSRVPACVHAKTAARRLPFHTF